MTGTKIFFSKLPYEKAPCGGPKFQCFYENLGSPQGDPGPGLQEGQWAWVTKRPQLCVAPEKGEASLHDPKG